MEGDLRDVETCRSACEGMDYILHHAAMASVPRSVEQPDECMAVNVQGTTNLLIAARDTGQVRRFVFASSSAVYGETPGLSKNEATFTDPLSPYATSKLTGEFLCRNFHRLYGLPTVALRYFQRLRSASRPEQPVCRRDSQIFGRAGRPSCARSSTATGNSRAILFLSTISSRLICAPAMRPSAMRAAKSSISAAASGLH